MQLGRNRIENFYWVKDKPGRYGEERRELKRFFTNRKRMKEEKKINKF